MSQRLISRLSSFSQSHLPDIRKIHHVKSYLEDEGKNHSLEYRAIHDSSKNVQNTTLLNENYFNTMPMQCSIMPWLNQKASYKSQYV